MGGGYKKYDTVKVNGRNRIRFVKANSKSKNPILYIKSDNKYITYKSFLRKRKIRGGADPINVMEMTTQEVLNTIGDKTAKLSINYMKRSGDNNNIQTFDMTKDDSLFSSRNLKKLFNECVKEYIDNDKDNKDKVEMFNSITLQFND
jgi:hypothetical protein